MSLSFEYELYTQTLQMKYLSQKTGSKFIQISQKLKIKTKNSLIHMETQKKISLSLNLIFELLTDLSEF